MRGGSGDRSVRTTIALALVAAAALRCAPCTAQTDEELAAARKLFTEAVADQDAKRYDTALEKFRRVASVKKTANVTFRIASCLDGLGHLAEAFVVYQEAVHLGETDRSAVEVVQAASVRAGQLDHVVPRLTVVVPADAPPGTEVRVDDALVETSSLTHALPLDPGHHTIAASAPGDVPFRTGVTLAEGSHVSISVTLQPEGTAAPPPAADGSTPTTTATTSAPPPVPSVEPPQHGAPAGAWVAFGLGGALAAGAVVSLVLQLNDLHTLDHDCTTIGSGKVSCPRSLSDTVTSAGNAARVEGPLAIGLAAGAAVAAGVGVWLLVSSPRDGVRVTPVVTQRGGMLMLGGPLAP
jgi:hypothetical protein